MKRKLNIKKYFIAVSVIFIIGIFFVYSFRFIKYYLEENSISEEDGTKITYFSDALEITINISDTSGGLYINNDKYVYKNKTDENYLWYSGHLWRILGINEDKTIDLIMANSLSLLNLNYEDKDYLRNYLEDFYLTLDNEYLVKTDYCADKLNDIKNITCDVMNEANITLLDLTTYNVAGGANSFINNDSYFWLINQTAEGEYLFINNNGELSINKETIAFNVRPVIRLKDSLALKSGIGTLENPYIIKTNNNDIISGAFVGDYVSFNQTKWRISSINGEAVTMISETCLKENNECLTMNFGLNNKYLDSNVYKYLNNTYYETIENKDFIVKTNFYIGEYTDYNYQKTIEETIEAYIGLPKVSDYFINDKINSFLLTPNITDTIYTISENGNYFLELPSTKKEIYPVINIDNSLKIASGDGTIINPYQISW